MIPQQILEPFIVYLSEEFTKKWVFVKLCLGVDFKKESIIIFWVFLILCSKKNVFKIDIGIQFFILGSKRNGFKVDLGQHILLCSFTVQLIYLVRPPIFIHPGLSSHWRKCLLQNIFYISLTLNCCFTPTIEVELIFSFFNIGLDSSLFAWYLQLRWNRFFACFNIGLVPGIFQFPDLKDALSYSNVVEGNLEEWQRLFW